MSLDGIEHRTTWFVYVRAVIEFTATSDAEDFTKVVSYFFRLHVERAKTFDAWDVDESTA